MLTVIKMKQGSGIKNDWMTVPPEKEQLPKEVAFELRHEKLPC